MFYAITHVSVRQYVEQSFDDRDRYSELAGCSEFSYNLKHGGT